MTNAIWSELWVQRLAWTLIHFLWQGAAITGLYACVRAVTRRSLPAHGRYALACVDARGGMTQGCHLLERRARSIVNHDDFRIDAGAGHRNRRGDVAVVIRTTADVAGHGRTDLIAGGMRMAVETRLRAHELA